MGEGADADGAITVNGLYDHIALNVQRRGMQTPVFRGDFAGRLLLGSGFTPRTPAGLLLEEKATEVEREAQRHLSDYQLRFAESYTDLAVWQQSGYKTACQMLEPILLWFNKRLKEFPTLANRKRFSELRDSAFQRLQPLCAVDVGTVLTEGTVRARLGSGLFGTVWRVVPLALGDLALKIYHPQDINEEEKVRRFRRGYEAMKQLDHPHIVKVHRFAECPLGFYMDYIDGPNLRKFSGTIDEPRILVTILLAVAETLQHANLRGVVHRDVKPENILMSYDVKTSQWRPYLTDFDLAWFSTATQVTNQQGIGTWQYSAPEQMKSPKSASAHAPTTDSFAFGQLCFFVMTGSDPVPLDESNNKRTLANRIHSGWLLKGAEMFTDLYGRCTERQPEKRPPFVEICKDLFTVSQLLNDVDSDSTLGEERFISDLVFSIVGLSPDHRIKDDCFLTLSGKTRVTISVLSRKGKNVELFYDFYSEAAPLLHGATSYDKMRGMIMAKIEAAVAQIAGISVKAGSQPPFQVLVRENPVSLSLDGLSEARNLIGQVCRAIEGG
jgi:serine/threonine protein kinase